VQLKVETKRRHAGALDEVGMFKSDWGGVERERSTIDPASPFVDLDDVAPKKEANPHLFV
jgi:hypothetical protein